MTGVRQFWQFKYRMAARWAVFFYGFGAVLFLITLWLHTHWIGYLVALWCLNRGADKWAAQAHMPQHRAPGRLLRRRLVSWEMSTM